MTVLSTAVRSLANGSACGYLIYTAAGYSAIGSMDLYLLNLCQFDLNLFNL